MCVMGLLITLAILLSLSASPVLSIDDIGDAGLRTPSFPRRSMGDHHQEGGRITREELRNRRALIVQSTPKARAVSCDGTMRQHPTLPPAPDDALNFFTIGDWGVRGLSVGSEAQLAVARGMSCVARKHPPKFVATLGDNFYPNGVTSVDDKQFLHKFEEVYNDVSLHDVPWYPSIGDHDHCGDVAAQAEYSLRSNRWTMPRAWYTQYINIPGSGGAVVQLIFVDWVALEGKFSSTDGDRRFHGQLSDAAGAETSARHWEWLRKVTNKGNPTWRIALGHRPLVSVSARAERDDKQYPAEAKARHAIREMMESVQVDLWINGHDHSAQVACSVSRDAKKMTHFITNGIGGYDLHALRRKSEWYEETKYANSSYHGFGVHRVTRDEISNYFLDYRGDVQHEFVIRKDSESCQ